MGARLPPNGAKLSMEPSRKRINIVVGHFGSGKSEFSVNYALYKGNKCKTALVDLDIANPYFRSREMQNFLESKRIDVYSNAYGYDITADLPAISAKIKKPLEDTNCITIVDAGGNDSGARVLHQFKKYFVPEITEILCIVNANRFETASFKTAMNHIISIEDEIGMKITSIINNTHMVWETSCEDILKGYKLCKEISKTKNIPIKYNCCVERLTEEVLLLTKEEKDFNIFPIKMYLRETWM